jgi:hypothetical protein
MCQPSIPWGLVQAWSVSPAHNRKASIRSWGASPCISINPCSIGGGCGLPLPYGPCRAHDEQVRHVPTATLAPHHGILKQLLSDFPPFLLHHHHPSIPSTCVSSTEYPYPLHPFSSTQPTSGHQPRSTASIMRTTAILSGVIALASAAPALVDNASSRPGPAIIAPRNDTKDGNWYVTIYSYFLPTFTDHLQAYWLRQGQQVRQGRARELLLLRGPHPCSRRVLLLLLPLTL